MSSDAKVKSVVTAVGDLAKMTPAELTARAQEIRRIRAERAKQEKEEQAVLDAMAALNKNEITACEFEIFVNRALARVYQKAAYAALVKLQSYNPSRRKVSFGRGQISDEYKPFIARFHKEVASYPDARKLADPTDLSKIGADETDDPDSATTVK